VSSEFGIRMVVQDPANPNQAYLQPRRALADISYSTSLSDEELMECHIHDTLAGWRRCFEAVTEAAAERMRSQWKISSKQNKRAIIKHNERTDFCSPLFRHQA